MAGPKDVNYVTDEFVLVLASRVDVDVVETAVVVNCPMMVVSTKFKNASNNHINTVVMENMNNVR